MHAQKIDELISISLIDMYNTTTTVEVSRPFRRNLSYWIPTGNAYNIADLRAISESSLF